MDDDELERYIYRGMRNLMNEEICVHQMPAKWCAICLEELKNKREREINVKIFENLADWAKDA